MLFSTVAVEATFEMLHAKACSVYCGFVEPVRAIAQCPFAGEARGFKEASCDADIRPTLRGKFVEKTDAVTNARDVVYA